MAALHSNIGATAAAGPAMALLSPSSPSSASAAAQIFRIGTTSSPPRTSSPRAPICCCSTSAAVACSIGRLRRRGSSPHVVQWSGIARILCFGGGISRGISRDSRMAGGILSVEEDYGSFVPSAFRGRGDGDPLYFVSEEFSTGQEGPVELPPREIEIDPFAFPEASPLQIVASVILTGAIVALSYRALRRRAARSKEMQFRSSGISTSKSIQEEARKTVIDNLTKAPEVPTPPPSPAQTFFGALVAGGIALVLYRFTSGVEEGFSVKAVSQDYSIRNLTITVRTIITGLCYLATFVFGANSIGLTLYGFQLLLGIGVSDSAAPPSDSTQNEEPKTDRRQETEDFSEK